MNLYRVDTSLVNTAATTHILRSLLFLVYYEVRGVWGPVLRVILQRDQKRSSVSPEATSSGERPVINGAGVEENTRAGKCL